MLVLFVWNDYRLLMSYRLLQPTVRPGPSSWRAPRHAQNSRLLSLNKALLRLHTNCILLDLISNSIHNFLTLIIVEMNTVQTSGLGLRVLTRG